MADMYRGEKMFTVEEIVERAMKRWGWPRERAEREVKTAIENGKLPYVEVDDDDPDLQPIN